MGVCLGTDTVFFRSLSDSAAVIQCNTESALVYGVNWIKSLYDTDVSLSAFLGLA